MVRGNCCLLCELAFRITHGVLLSRAALQPVGSQPELVLGVIPAQCTTSRVSAKLHEVVGLKFPKVLLD